MGSPRQDELVSRSLQDIACSLESINRRMTKYLDGLENDVKFEPDLQVCGFCYCYQAADLMLECEHARLCEACAPCDQCNP